MFYHKGSNPNKRLEITNSLDDVVALFFCDSWSPLRKHHVDLSLIGLEFDVIPFLEKDLVIVFLIFHGGLASFVDSRVQYLRFEDSNSRMNM